MLWVNSVDLGEPCDSSPWVNLGEPCNPSLKPLVPYLKKGS